MNMGTDYDFSTLQGFKFSSGSLRASIPVIYASSAHGKPQYEKDYDDAMLELNEEFPGLRDIEIGELYLKR